MKNNNRNIIILIAVLLAVIIIAVFIYYKYYYPYSDNPPLIGGCAGVSLEYRQECCDNWAAENNIVHVQCVGEWTINEDNKCAWECEAA
jgi:hypothetical protein